MDNEIFDDIEWEISSFWSTMSSGDEIGDWIYEFDAIGVDDNGNEISGIAYYNGDDDGSNLNFSHVEYELPQEDDEEDEEW